MASSRRRPTALRGSRSGKVVPAAKGGHVFADPTACERCGAVFTRKTWRRRGVDPELFQRAAWDVCPACRQEAGAEFHGRVVVAGALPPALLEEVERRIRNVAERAEFTQPERRVIDVRMGADALEILTTSQKLAHRLARELEKAFGGRALYAWSDRDGRLVASWQL
jgi:NMD protein affecting ribosome stability and mRNA decay